MIVIDASATVDLLLRRGQHERIAELAAAHDIHAPELLTVEVLQAVRRFEHRGELTVRRAAEAVDDLVDLPVECYPVSAATRPIWALRGAVSAYDAAYVVLAAGLEAPLLTTDQRLARTAARHCRIADL